MRSITIHLHLSNSSNGIFYHRDDPPHTTRLPICERHAIIPPAHGVGKCNHSARRFSRSDDFKWRSLKSVRRSQPHALRDEVLHNQCSWLSHRYSPGPLTLPHLRLRCLSYGPVPTTHYTHPSAVVALIARLSLRIEISAEVASYPAAATAFCTDTVSVGGAAIGGEFASFVSSSLIPVPLVLCACCRTSGRHLARSLVVGALASSSGISC